MAWDNLSDTDKADAIINTVDLTLDLVAANGAEAVKKLNSAYDKVDDYLDGLKSYREREASYFVEEVEMNDFAKVCGLIQTVSVVHCSLASQLRKLLL